MNKDNVQDYLSKRIKVIEGEWAGWYSCRDPFERVAGPFYFRIDDTGPVCAFRVEPRHLNGMGHLHGGCMMTFADFSLFVIGRLALRDQSAVTATFNCELVGRAVAGQQVECRGEIIMDARSMMFVRGLMSVEGQIVLSFSSALKKQNVARP